MDGTLNDLFELNLVSVTDSEYRFSINRARSVVTFDGNEFLPEVERDTIDIYAMYNDIERRPFVISMTNVKGDKLKIVTHPKYKISYISESGDSVTYIRYDALGILSEDDISAMLMRYRDLNGED